MNQSEKAFKKYKEYKAKILELNNKIANLKEREKELEREIELENLISLINRKKD